MFTVYFQSVRCQSSVMFTVYFQSVRCRSSVMFTVYFQSVRCQSSVTFTALLSSVRCQSSVMFTVYFQSVRCQSSVIFTVYFQSVRCQSSVTVQRSTVSCSTHNRSVQKKAKVVKKKKFKWLEALLGMSIHTDFLAIGAIAKNGYSIHFFASLTLSLRAQYERNLHSMFLWIRFTIFGPPLGKISWPSMSPHLLLEINWVNFVNTRSPAYNVLGLQRTLGFCQQIPLYQNHWQQNWRESSVTSSFRVCLYDSFLCIFLRVINRHSAYIHPLNVGPGPVYTQQKQMWNFSVDNCCCLVK